MAIPILKSFDCLDHDPIDEWIPKSNDVAHYFLCMSIGPADEEGADLFHVEVVTPQAINNLNLGRSLNQRRIIVNPYSWEKVLNEIQLILESCKEGSWSQQAEFLTNHFDWEFENYKPYTQ